MENEEAKKVVASSFDYLFDNLDNLSSKVSATGARLNGLEHVVKKIIAASPYLSGVREYVGLPVTDNNGSTESAAVADADTGPAAGPIPAPNDEVQKLRDQLQVATAEMKKRDERLAAFRCSMQILNDEFKSVAELLLIQYTSGLFTPKWSTTLAMRVMGMAEHVGSFLKENDTQAAEGYYSISDYASEEDFPAKLRRQAIDDE